MITDNNHRQELRLDSDDTIFIEVHHRYEEQGQNSSTVLICNSVDVSANGIQAIIDKPLPLEAIYPLCIEVAETAQQICLVAQVKWLRQHSDNATYSVGLMIFESDDTDIEQWKRYIADKLSEQQ